MVRGRGEEGGKRERMIDMTLYFSPLDSGLSLEVWLSESDPRVEKVFNPAVFPPANHNLSKVVVS